MTYFETPNQQAAFYAGMDVEAYEYAMDQQEREMDALEDAFRPDVDPEFNRYVRESDVLDPVRDYTVESIDRMEAEFRSWLR